MNPSDPELPRLTRLFHAACPPIEPPPGLERRIRRAVAAKRSASPGAALLRFLVPYAAGALTVLGVDRARPLPEPSPAPASLSFSAIADRAPPPVADEPFVVAPAFDLVPKIS